MAKTTTPGYEGACFASGWYDELLSQVNYKLTISFYPIVVLNSFSVKKYVYIIFAYHKKLWDLIATAQFRKVSFQLKSIVFF